MTTIERFLNTYTEEVASLSQHLRQFVLQTIPEADEKLQSGWKSITYSHKKAFCSILPHSNWVNLQFQAGANLHDPAKRLQGTGKNMRHVRISDASDLDNSLAELIRQASGLAK